MKKYRPRRFTLLELLIVISIISILSGLLLPVISQTRRKAKFAECASNLRQIGIAFSTYTADYNGYYPVASMKPSVSTGEPRICDVLQDYAGNNNVFQCPEDIKPERSYSGNTANSTFFEEEGCSYEYACMLGGRKEGESKGPGPTKIIVMYDYECFHRPVSNFSISQDESVTKKGGSKNYLFADWHVNDKL